MGNPKRQRQKRKQKPQIRERRDSALPRQCNGAGRRSEDEHGAPEKARAKRKQKPQTFKVRRSALHKQNDARQMTARFLPTRSKISRARSRSARLCVAVTMVRKRA